MSWRQQIFPFAAKAIDDADTAPLPNRAIPFIWHFVKRLKVTLGATTFLYGFACAITALEPLFIGGIIAGITASQFETAIQWAAAYFIICQVISRICFQLGFAMENHFTPLITMLVRRRLATYLHGHGYTYFQDDMAGKLAGKVIEMPNAVTETIVETINMVFYVGIGALVSTILLAALDWRFGLLAACFYGGAFFNLKYHYSEISRRGTLATEAVNVMRGKFLDSISNILLVKLFARFKYEDTRLSGSLVKAAAAKTAEQLKFRHVWGGQHILNAILQGGIVILCLWGWQQGTLSTIEIATALPLSVQMAVNIWWAIATATTYISRFATIQDGLDTIIQPYEVADRATVQDWQPKTGAIEINTITFAYPARAIFDDFSLTIPAGQKVGLVGPSGAGKSTLLQLLLRLHDVQAGSITIDGQNIAEVAQDDLRGAIAMLPQQADLLHRSIADNIRYGRLEATDAEVKEAARQAEAHDFIMQLPQGYDSLVGERGVKLSGGQRQRIAIARAFIKDAPILILDEPTSALDSESEAAIQKSLATLMQGRTALVIAHRLSTIAHLDRIVVLDQGRIVEDGTHTELLDRNGLYARLWHLQTEGFIGA